MYNLGIESEDLDRSIASFRGTVRLDKSIREFCAILLDVLQRKDLSPTREPLENLLDRPWSFEEKQFIACCLLRVLDYNAAVFDEGRIRAKSCVLFDEVFGGAVYNKLNITEDDLNHNKIEKLNGQISKLYQQTAQIVNSIESLKSYQTLRNSLMKTFQSKYAKSLLLPFLPEQLLEAPLSDVFLAIEEYLVNVEELSTVKYQQCHKILEGFTRESAKYPTFYCKGILAKLGHKLIELLDNDFHSNPLNQPAEIGIKVFEKKYPLHRPNEQFILIVSIENSGKGVAHQVEVTLAETTEMAIDKQRQWVGAIGPKKSRQVQFAGLVAAPTDGILARINIQYTNSDGEVHLCNEELAFYAQSPHVDWARYESKQSYSLEPITNESQFVGREKLLATLQSIIHSTQTVGSAVVHGQKRVGKTSLANTLIARLERELGDDLITVYLEAGEYIDPDATATAINLGRRIVKKLKIDRRLELIPSPEFVSSLSPLTDFLQIVVRQLPRTKVLIVLDEFDELPIDLYKRGSAGDALFLTLRSISGIPQIGFLLVGAESMDFVLGSQGDRLNKFQPIRVDYFDRETNWPDFVALVRNPTQQWLEVSDKALEAIHSETAGNPYFTILLCQEVERLMLDRKDCHATEFEIREAVRACLRRTKSNAFQHFWDDKIPQSGPDKEVISVNRRRFLLAFGEARRSGQPITRQLLTTYSDQYGLSAVETENLEREFTQRQIVTELGNEYRCVVGLFDSWLKENGPLEISTVLLDSDNIVRQKVEEERQRITTNEIVSLLKSKQFFFKGSEIGEDSVRDWLSQFGTNVQQRYAFTILKELRFYSQKSIRRKLIEAHDIVSRGLVFKRTGRQTKRDDLIVSYIDAAARSGAHLARIYADENRIYKEDVVAKGDIRKKLEEKADDCDAISLVFVDDIVGTGENACRYFKELEEADGDFLRRLASRKDYGGSRSKLKIHFVAIAGLSEGQRRLRDCLNDLSLPVDVNICDPLDESDRVFQERSRVFPDRADRERARQCIAEIGGRLEKKWPLGYNDCQLIVVFEHNCPNDSLPVLYKSTTEFTALFPRS